VMNKSTIIYHKKLTAEQCTETSVTVATVMNKSTIIYHKKELKSTLKSEMLLKH
jgi:hypothetical protein